MGRAREQAQPGRNLTVVSSGWYALLLKFPEIEINQKKHGSVF